MVHFSAFRVTLSDLQNGLRVACEMSNLRDNFRLSSVFLVLKLAAGKRQTRRKAYWGLVHRRPIKTQLEMGSAYYFTTNHHVKMPA